MKRLILVLFFVMSWNKCSFSAEENIIDFNSLINKPNLKLIAANLSLEKKRLARDISHQMQEKKEEGKRKKSRMKATLLRVKNQEIQQKNEQALAMEQYETNVVAQKTNFNLLEQKLDDIGNLASQQKNRLCISFNTQMNNGPSQVNLVNSMTDILRIDTMEIHSHTERWRNHLENIDLGDNRNVEENPKFVGLSIDGGGIRGLIPALLCQDIEGHMNGKRLYEVVDFLGGSSVGGILSLGLTSRQLNQQSPFRAEELVGFFTQHGREIFPHVPFKGIQQIFTNIYPSSGIENLLLTYFGPQQTLRDTLKPVLITAVTTHGRPFTFETSKARASLGDNFLIKDVARATSAAPTYFSAARVQSSNGTVHELLDGGVWCNNPSRWVHDALMRYNQLNNNSDTAIISLGTGEAFPSRVGANAGLLDDGERIVSTFQNSHVFGINESMNNILGNQFYRVQPELGFNINLDETREEYLEYLTACAETQYSKTEKIARFLLRNYDLRYNQF